ncbi:HepT-like ribonuclease domain-containing protein [Solimicrobium silvestre]|uniref:DUF86 domain-containing protein n=1 Tax=Solimicrobium silvestre TaxID=2099400 RepID=A0A2S9GYU2_9BURK|nr:DUF86 domain-containing protein [Solimicrobium silvestre]PRC92894.1 hypothetical protein S2091_2311 [Solimicrobium silvestre]
MSKNELRVPDYLGHIQQAIERIHRYIEDLDEVVFLNNEMIQDAVIRNIEIVGEASNNIVKFAPDFAALHSEIPWSVIYAMRNRVAHAYHKVDLELVWNMIQNDLPVLHQQIVTLLNNLDHPHH